VVSGQWQSVAFLMAMLRPHCDFLDVVIFTVCNVDVAVGCHRDANRFVELPFARTRRTPFGDERRTRDECGRRRGGRCRSSSHADLTGP